MAGLLLGAGVKVDGVVEGRGDEPLELRARKGPADLWGREDAQRGPILFLLCWFRGGSLRGETKGIKGEGVRGERG